jgi:PKD repeat protein
MRTRRWLGVGLSLASMMVMAGYGNLVASADQATTGTLSAPRVGSKISPKAARLMQKLEVTSSATPTEGGAPLKVAFTCQPKGGLAPYKFAWNFGDNTTSTLKNPRHVYKTTAKFTAVVTVKDSSKPNPEQVSASGITIDLTHATEQVPTSWETHEIKP